MTHSHKKNSYSQFLSWFFIWHYRARLSDEKKKPLSTISVKCVKRKSSFFLLEKFQRQAFIPKYCAKQTLKILGIAVPWTFSNADIYVRLINLVSLGKCMCTHGRVSFFAYNFHKSCVNTFNKGDNFSLFKFIGSISLGRKWWKWVRYSLDLHRSCIYT